MMGFVTERFSRGWGYTKLLALHSKLSVEQFFLDMKRRGITKQELNARGFSFETNDKGEGYAVQHSTGKRLECNFIEGEAYLYTSNWLFVANNIDEFVDKFALVSKKLEEEEKVADE